MQQVHVIKRVEGTCSAGDGDGDNTDDKRSSMVQQNPTKINEYSNAMMIGIVCLFFFIGGEGTIKKWELSTNREHSG